MERRSSAYPTPLPRCDGATQICVMCPVSRATRLASEIPHSSPLPPFEANAAKDAGGKKVPHPGYCTMLFKNRRDPLGERYWSLISLSMCPRYDDATSRAESSC